MKGTISPLSQLSGFALVLCIAISAWSQVTPAPKGRIDSDTRVKVTAVERTKELVISKDYKFTAGEGEEFAVVKLEIQCPNGQKTVVLERARTTLVDSDERKYPLYAREYSLTCYQDSFNAIDVPFKVPVGIKLRRLEIEGVSINLK